MKELNFTVLHKTYAKKAIKNALVKSSLYFLGLVGIGSFLFFSNPQQLDPAEGIPIGTFILMGILVSVFGLGLLITETLSRPEVTVYPEDPAIKQIFKDVALQLPDDIAREIANASSGSYSFLLFTGKQKTLNFWNKDSTCNFAISEKEIWVQAIINGEPQEQFQMVAE